MPLHILRDKNCIHHLYLLSFLFVITCILFCSFYDLLNTNSSFVKKKNWILALPVAYDSALVLLVLICLVFDSLPVLLKIFWLELTMLAYIVLIYII